MAHDSYILFQVGGSTYAVRSDLVQQVEMVENVTPLPGAPNFIDGVVFARGQVIPALNVRQRFGLEKAPYDGRTRLIVVSPENRRVGLIVDGAREFIRIAPEAIRLPHEVITDINDRYLEGIATLGERIIIILNIVEVAAFKEASASPALAN